MKEIKITNNNNNNNKNIVGLKTLLEEADKITLDDLDFNKILQEQSSILCDIKRILHYENNPNNKEEFKCNIMHLKKDKKLHHMINEYKNNNKNSKNKFNILNSSPKKRSSSPKKRSSLPKKRSSLPKKLSSPKKRSTSHKKRFKNNCKSNNKSNKTSIKKSIKTSINNIKNNSNYFDISGTIKLEKHKK